MTDPLGADSELILPPDELSLPAGWVIDWIARDRLARQLALAPPEVVGVAASMESIAPGASYRTHAERCALRPMTAREEVDPARGAAPAVLRRRARRDADLPEDGARILLDHGAHVHDPGGGGSGRTEPASPEGRSPFPARPVVVFVQGASNDFDDRLRVLVNELLSADVEARIAASTVPPGPHLTRPCAPVPASLDSLDPDIVVPTDRAARDLVGEWSESARRSVISVDVDADGPEVELLSWQRSSGDGRTRARVNLSVETRTFADLVTRLCSGPRPLRPLDVGL